MLRYLQTSTRGPRAATRPLARTPVANQQSSSSEAQVSFNKAIQAIPRYAPRPLPLLAAAPVTASTHWFDAVSSNNADYKSGLIGGKRLIIHIPDALAVFEPQLATFRFKVPARYAKAFVGKSFNLQSPFPKGYMYAPLGESADTDTREYLQELTSVMPYDIQNSTAERNKRLIAIFTREHGLVVRIKRVEVGRNRTVRTEIDYYLEAKEWSPRSSRPASSAGSPAGGSQVSSQATSRRPSLA